MKIFLNEFDIEAKEDWMESIKRKMERIVKMKGGEKMMRKFFLLGIGLIILGMIVVPSAMAVGTLAGTVISNQAYVDYQDVNGNPKTRVYSNIVTTVVSQVASVSVTPMTAAKSGLAGGKVYYGVTICNTGNGPDTISLALSSNTWTSVIYYDANGDGMWDPVNETTVVSSTTVLAADACYKILVVVTIPPSTPDGATDTVTINATSQFNNSVFASGTYTTTAQTAVFDINKYVVDSPVNPVPGDIITYKLTGHNAGTAATQDIRAEDIIPAGTTYVPGSLRFGPITANYNDAIPLTDANDGYEVSGIGAYFDGTKVIYIRDQFNPGDKGSFFFKVQVNSGVLENTPISNYITAYYKHIGLPTEYSATSNTTTSYVGFKAAVDLNPNGMKYGNTGDQIVYQFTATNNGNAADRINITIPSSTMGWSWTIWMDADDNGIPGTNGDYILTDTNGDGIIDTGILTPNGGSRNLLAVVTIPAGTADQAIDVTVVKGTSVRNNSIYDSITLTTHVKAPVLTITKTVSPTGNQPPGTELTYTITVSNIGTGVATSVQIFDVIPAYTTYVANSIETGPNVSSLYPRTDTSDGDGGRYDPVAKMVSAGSGTSISLGPGGTWVLRFKVKID